MVRVTPRKVLLAILVTINIGATLVILTLFSGESKPAKHNIERAAMLEQKHAKFTKSKSDGQYLIFKAVNSFQNRTVYGQGYKVPFVQNIATPSPVPTPKQKTEKPFLTMYPTDARIQRLGNQMFQFASVLGIAYMNNLPAFIACNHMLKRIFEISIPCIRPEKIRRPGMRRWKEEAAGTYNKSVEHLGNNASVEVVGYLQSWKYFHQIGGVIREQFTFREDIRSLANREIEDALQRKNKKADYRIGIHIRRGDIMSPIFRKAGMVFADAAYINRAMSFVKERYAKRPYVFIVCSDDIAWAIANIHDEDIVYVESGYEYPDVDLAVLTACDAMVITTGTFGWWAGWLSGGPVVYYKHSLIPNTPIGGQYNSTDYYPPWWIGL